MQMRGLYKVLSEKYYKKKVHAFPIFLYQNKLLLKPARDRLCKQMVETNIVLSGSKNLG